MTFEDDKKLAEDAQPLQDEVYRRILPVDSITRYDKGEYDERHILDREHHIDIELKLANDTVLLGQEKALRERFSHYDTFTIEFYQNRHTKELGEFFHIGAQFYFHCYINKNRDELLKWYFIKLFDFIESLKDKPREELEEQTRPTKGSNASFYYIRYDNIPSEFIYAAEPESGEPILPQGGWDGTTANDALDGHDSPQSGLGKYI